MTATLTALRRKTLYAKRDDYWNEIEAHREYGKLVEWAFDFISVHKRNGEFSLMSPLKLVRDSGRRPSFERKRFEKKGDAIRFARRMMRRLRDIGITVHIVCCD